MKARANYTFRLIEGVLVIEDLNLGKVSVTNDIENVLADIVPFMPDKKLPKTVIYRDSDGLWDEVVDLEHYLKCPAFRLWRYSSYMDLIQVLKEK